MRCASRESYSCLKRGRDGVLTGEEPVSRAADDLGTGSLLTRLVGVDSFLTLVAFPGAISSTCLRFEGDDFFGVTS